MVAGLRSITKAMELPPTPTVLAPALDPTCERLGVRLPGATLPTGTRLAVGLLLFCYWRYLAAIREPARRCR